MNRALVVVHLRAEQATGQGVGGIAGNAHGAAVFHLNQQAAGIGTVIGADGANDSGAHGNLPSGSCGMKHHTLF
jgi:hypothetical protein